MAQKEIACDEIVGSVAKQVKAPAGARQNSFQTVHSSLTGLDSFLDLNPRLKPWATFGDCSAANAFDWRRCSLDPIKRVSDFHALAVDLTGNDWFCPVLLKESIASGEESSVSKEKTVVSEIKTAVSELKAVVSTSDSIVSEVDSPVSEVEMTVSGLKTAASESETVASRPETTVSKSEATVSGVKTTVSKLRMNVSGTKLARLAVAISAQ